MGIPESGRGKHGAGYCPIGTHNIKLRPVPGDEVLGAESGRSPVSRRDRKGDGPVARHRAAGGTHAGIPSPVSSWSPVDVAFGGAGTRTENRERAGARRILRGFRPYGGGYGACGQRHVHHPYALGTFRAVRDGAAASGMFPRRHTSPWNRRTGNTWPEPGIPTDKNATACFPWPEFRAIRPCGHWGERTGETSKEKTQWRV